MTVPDEFEGLQMIKTANDDKKKDSTDLNFHFYITKDANIYIAYDHRLIPQDWLTYDYTNIGKQILVSDGYESQFNVWKRTAEAGTVSLGKNADIGASSMYFVFFAEVSNVNLSCKILLEGPYLNNGMQTTLKQSEILPLTQPYNCEPWNYEGNENVATIPADVVDWALIELRKIGDNTTFETRRAAFLLNTGDIVDLDGSSPVQFSVEDDEYYIVVIHRNHLGVMSSSVVTF